MYIDYTQDSLNQTYSRFGPEPENPPLQLFQMSLSLSLQ